FAVGIVTFLFGALAHPANRDAQLRGGGHYEITYRVLNAGGNHKIFGLWLLQYQPRGFDVITCVSPVAPCIEISEVQAILQAQFDASQSPGDLAGYKGLAAAGGLVIEQNAIAGMDAI